MLSLKVFRLGYRTGAIVCITYALIAGLCLTLPNMGGNMAQTSRNVFYHIPMWFTMYLLMGISVIQSILYLKTGNLNKDIRASAASQTGIYFGLMGLSTGIIWSRVTWRALIPSNDFAAWWSWDPKLTLVVVALSVYIAYFLLRSNIEEHGQKARISAVYNIFAAASLLPLTLLLPRLLGGLHPGGEEGNPLDNVKLAAEFRVIFYPAVLGFLCLGLWLFELNVRSRMLSNPTHEQ